ncbi:hypothetical protein CYLTODRAFT_361075, partial [Cylindrobasidium torrendii FP15055 ss-10]
MELCTGAHGYDSDKLHRDSFVSLFTLNPEQERVFQMVAQHNEDSQGQQLRLYVAGPAGSGKSRVLQALRAYFKSRKEEYKLAVIAPTGAAASLVGGATYHSFLGFSGYALEVSEEKLAKLRSNMLGVRYIFLDEVSMLSCKDLFNISSRL